MTYKASDIEHLKLMNSLAKKKANEISPKELISSLIPKNKISFSEKIITLCDKLKANGFDKYADNIENNFLQYKAAKSKEPAEALVEEAHPEGDVRFAPSEEDYGVVMTQVSKHKKILDNVMREPKLASYIHQCKIILGYDQPEKAASAKYFTAAIEDISAAYNVLKKHESSSIESILSGTFFESKLEETISSISVTKSFLSSIFAKMDTYTISSLQEFVANMSGNIKKNINDLSNLSKTVRQQSVQNDIATAIDFLNTGLKKVYAIGWALKEDGEEGAEFQASQMDSGKIFSTIRNLKTLLKNLNVYVKDKHSPQTDPYINNLFAVAKGLLEDFAKIEKSIPKDTFDFGTLKGLLSTSKYFSNLNDFADFEKRINNIHSIIIEGLKTQLKVNVGL